MWFLETTHIALGNGFKAHMLLKSVAWTDTTVS